ncbi:MAG: ABC transporter substrate-binding protein, partial [Pirellulaceae bacterium]|nr:ABC transporter substrate-binding protein [Pirellulaceae bacterium]
TSGSAGSATLVYAQPEDPKTLDPINTDIAEAVHVLTNLLDTLVTYDNERAEIVPALAECWEHTPDGLAWTFHLRPGVVFHDGTPCNAAAVKTSFDRLIAEKHPLAFDTARPYRAAYNMIDQIETPDDLVVVLKLNHPSANLLANLAMFAASVVSPTALEKHGAGFGEHPVGTGPFKFVRWTRDQQLVCAAFDQHWRGRPKIDNLVWVPVRENATRVQRLARGEVQVAENLTPVELDLLTKNPRLAIQEQTGMNVAYLTMQVEKPPLNNRKVREAIYRAIDKPTLIKLGYGGHAQPAKTLVPPAMWGHAGDLTDLEYDPARARELLKEAAAEAGFTLPLALSLAVMSEARPYLQQPEAIQGYMKEALGEIGIEVTIDARSVNQHFEHLMAGRHQLGLAGWNSDNSDPDNFLYSLLDPDNIAEQGNNLSRWRNDRFHELMLAGQRELDVAKRLAIYHEAQAIVLQELPVVPLVHTKLRAAHSKELQGFKLHPTGLIRLRNAWFEAAP